MADLHVWHAAGASAAPYGTWATAAVNLSTAAAAAAAGDTIYVAHDHAETAAGQTIAFTGTLPLPTRVLCGTRTGTATETGVSGLATTANIKSSTTTFVLGGIAYVYGVQFELAAASATGLYSANTSTSYMVYEDCQFLLATGTTSSLRTGWNAAATTQSKCIFKNCTMKFSATGQWLEADGITEIHDGGIITGGSTPTTFCKMGVGNRGGILLLTGFDFVNFGTGFDVFGPGNTTQFGRLRNCKFPSGWTGEIHTAAPTAGGTRWEMLNYGDGDTNYKFWTSDVNGQCKDDIVTYRDTGASDETVPQSMVMISNANCSLTHPLVSLPFAKRVELGASQTITVHFAGAAALTNAEAWIEVEYLGNSGFPLGSYIKSRVQMLGTPAAHTDTSGGSAVWSGSPATQQSTAVTASMAENGYIIVKFCLAKPSATVYVDTKIEIS